MYSLRKWLYKPKKTDTSLLAQFYHSDEELYLVASELDSFDGRRDPERCAMLVNELRFWQDSVLSTIEKVMDDAIPSHRTSRDFRVKFPDDVLHESLAGQLWFGAECLAAGSIIMNREVESASMRPLARALTKNLDSLRTILRDQCLRNINSYTDKAKEALVIFDKLLAEFELSYVSSMVPVKTMKEYDLMQEVIVLFSETLTRALRLKLLTQDLVDDYEPAVMFTIPRLAIVCGLLVYPEGPLNPDNSSHNMSEMFRPFQTLLHKIRELLHTLTTQELYQLEKLLCSQDQGVSLTDDYLSFSDYTNQHPHDKSAPPLPTTTRVPGPTTLLCDHTHIIAHSPDSGGSPVTPVNDDEVTTSTFLSSSISKSSIATIVAKQPSTSDPDSDEASIDDGDVNFVYLRSDIEAITDVICPSGEERMKSSGGQRSQRDSDSGLHSDNCSLADVVSANVPECSDSACGVSVTSGDFVECDTASFAAQEATDVHDEACGYSGPHDACGDTSCSADDCNKSSSCDNVIIDQQLLTSIHRSCGCCNAECTLSCDSACDCSGSSGHTRGISATQDYTQETEYSESSTNCNTLPPNVVTHQHSSSAMPSDNQGSSDDTQTAGADCLHETPATDIQPVINTACVIPNLLATTVHRTARSDIRVHTRLSSTIKQNDNLTLRMQPNYFCDSRRTHAQPRTDTQPRTDAQPPTRATNKNPKHKNDNAQSSLSNPVIPSSDVKPKIKEKNVQEDMCARCYRCAEGSMDGKVVCSTSDDLDTHSVGSSDTSSYNSESHDDEEIALAIHAAEMASRNEVRSRFQNSSDLIHRLFVCVSGVADQLQTNYASDLRNILKCVFDMNCTDPPSPPTDDKTTGVSMAMNHLVRPAATQNIRPSSTPRDTPTWLPDLASSSCMGCHVPFTLTRRRHHCRNCGKLFCSRCSSNSVPLPHFGHTKAVRVCIRCFIYHVTPFTASNT